MNKENSSTLYSNAKEVMPGGVNSPVRAFNAVGGEPLFIKIDGTIIRYDGDEKLVPVFINEAAYAEKNIAMSLSKREVWHFTQEWENAINQILFS